MINIKHLTKKRILISSLAGVLVMALALVSVLPSVFAISNYSLSNAGVELDGTEDKTVTINLVTPETDTIFGFQGTFLPSVAVGGDVYMTLTALTPGGDVSPMSNSTSDGIVYWLDGSYTGFALDEGGAIWSATYTVDKDTPAGDYQVSLTNAEVTSEGNDYDTVSLGTINATITVAREEAEKPAQTIVFKDGNDNVIGNEGITKYYGDDDFVVTKEVIEGDGNIVEYHPDDDGTGRIAHTVPNSDYVGVGEVGDVAICARAEETENYAETTACYTVHVTKRPITIASVVVRNKDYDGNTDATVDNVGFEDKNLSQEEYNATAVFDGADVGEHTVAVTVELVGTGAEHYTLDDNTYETTATINVVELSNVRASIPSQEYTGSALTPEVTVSGELNNEEVTLTEGVDYSLNYSPDMINVDTYGVTISPVSGSNYSFEEFVENFTITKKTVSVVSAGVADKTYDGTNVADINSVVLSDDALSYGVDFTAQATFAENYVGSWAVVVNITLSEDAYKNYQFCPAGGECTDSVAYGIESATISPLSLNNDNTTGELSTTNYNYSGEQNKPTATVMIDLDGDGVKETTLTENVDYAIEYSEDTVNVGTKYATIVGMGNYSNKISGLAYYVNVAPVENVVVTAPAQTFSGVALEPVPVVTGTVNGNPVTFTADDYYVLDHADFINADSYTFGIASGYNSNYYIPITNGAFTIDPYEIASSNVSLDSNAVRYNGEEQRVGATVMVGDYVVDASAYEVSYSADVIGNDTTDTTVTVTITAKADQNITGSANASYVITPRDILTIGGIDDGQQIAYTGSEVELAGDLTVSDNTDGVTASSLTTTWYEADGVTEIARPTNVGSYVVKYTYDGTNYKGELAVGFSIVKAVSPNPSEMTDDLRVVAGETLSDIEGTRTTGFAWSNSDAVVDTGAGTYSATYTYNNDMDNYTTLDLAVPVYGLSLINIETSVNGVGGTISGAMVDVVEGETVTVSVEPEENHILKSITVNGVEKINEVSNNRLSITAGTDDLAVVAIFVPHYEVIEGAGQNYVIGEDDTATFVVNADYELFEDGGMVFVDGLLVDRTNYSSESGSTVITFTAEFMSSLEAGEHTLMVLFNDGGLAETTFTVEKVEEEETTEVAGTPDTGAFTGSTGLVASAIILPAVAMMIIGGVKLYRRRELMK